MKKLIIALTFAATSAFSATQLQSGDVIQIEDFQYVVMHRAEYESLVRSVNYIASCLDAAQSNETGRVSLHGRRGHTTITNGVATVEYADGYKYSQKLSKQKVSAKPQAKEKSAFEKMRDEIRRRRREALARTNEVTVTVGGGK